MILRILSLMLLTQTTTVLASDLWGKDAELPGNQRCFNSHGHPVCLSDGNRKNIHNLDTEELKLALLNGSKHIHQYPVSTTRINLPVKPMEKIFNSESNSPLRKIIFSMTKFFSKIKSFDDLFNWLGLNHSPKNELQHGPNLITKTQGINKYHRLGVSYNKSSLNSETINFSCTTCHSNDLFGTKVIGLTNRFPRSNEFFVEAKKAISLVTPALLDLYLGDITQTDKEILMEAKRAVRYVGLKKPLALGLDTSLAQVGLSLARRSKDEYATMKPFILPRSNELSRKPADSKPGVWWNLKYKTKWLLDGSIDSGNPIYTNFLWNEIGRGADLKDLEEWFADNQEKIRDLTSYAFNTEPPIYNDFFPRKINIAKAKRGEKLYLKSCKGCHGIYEKGWSEETKLPYEEKLKTTKVWYHTKTPSINIGTDNHRVKGMSYFAEDLNRLKISKTFNTVVTPKEGYVPPPLVGIWARWPYFHNNSVPTLYDVISPDFKRPDSYISVPAISKKLDFDIDKNGYPDKSKVRSIYRSKAKKDHFFNTRITGLSNSGHTKMLLNKDGTEKFSSEEKYEIIEFLKTL